MNTQSNIFSQGHYSKGQGQPQK